MVMDESTLKSLKGFFRGRCEEYAEEKKALQYYKDGLLNAVIESNGGNLEYTDYTAAWMCQTIARTKVLGVMDDWITFFMGYMDSCGHGEEFRDIYNEEVCEMR